MIRKAVLLAASLVFISSITSAQTADKPKDAPVALEKKLLGVWEAGRDCVGDLTLRADGTFDRLRYSPGNNKLTGTWEVRWNALPPTLVLTCKTSDERDRFSVGKTTEVKVIQLDDAALSLAYEDPMNQGGQPIRYMRVEAPVALKRKLHGDWQGPACGGDYTFYPDGTFDCWHFSPGDNTLTGTWSLRWDELPPKLLLTCKTSDFKKKDPSREEYEYLGKTLEVKLLQLDDEALVCEYPNESLFRSTRAK